MTWSLPKPETPILDLSRPVPSKNSIAPTNGWTVLLAFLVAGCLFAIALRFLDAHPRLAAGIGLYMQARNAGYPSGGIEGGLFGPVLPYVVFVGIAISAVIIHELGHVAAGWVMRFRVSGVVLGPIFIFAKNRALRVSFGRFSEHSAAALITIKSFKNIRWRFLAFVCGGIAANVLCGVLAWAVLLLRGPVGDTLTIALEDLAGFSMFLAFLNLIPSVTRGTRSDGEQIMTMLLCRRRRQQYISLMKLKAQHADGKMYSDLNPRRVAIAARMNDGSIESFEAKKIAYAYLSGNHLHCEAAVQLEECLRFARYLVPSKRRMIFFEAAVFQAWFMSDAAKARLWAEAAKPKGAHDVALQAAKIALNWCEGDLDAALKLWAEVREKIAAAPGTRRKERVLQEWDEWRTELETRRPGEPLLCKPKKRAFTASPFPAA